MKQEYITPIIKTSDPNAFTFIDLRLDFAFGLVFGTKGNEDMLLKLVNAILPNLNIESVTLSNQSQPGRRRDARSAIFDVACTTSAGHIIIIEMQYRHQDDFNDRLLFYSTFPLQNSLKAGEGTYRFKPTYIVGITDFIIKDIKANDRIVNRYSSTNEDDSEIRLTDNLCYVTVELPKVKKELDAIHSPAELMFYTIRNIGSMNKMPDNYIGSGLEKLFEICKFAAMDELTQADYLRAFMADLDLRSQKRTAFKEGVEEGKTEASIKIAASLRAHGVPVDLIVSATGLSAEQVETL
ncbi:MAG: Rpn family recombination-promoting nuclease/putative transposase [Bacteroidales bacterium]|nr:Rpn family recombination-promoting nuclease/putative transposase [Bacteroidales bacterium]